MRYTFADCELDTELYTLRRAGQTLPLRPKVFQVLHYLVEHRHRVVPKQELLEHVWPAHFISDATLDNCIKEVRRVIGDSGREQRLIHTLRGYGYHFVAAVTLPDHTTDTDDRPSTPPVAATTASPGEGMALPLAPPAAPPVPDAAGEGRPPAPLVRADLSDQPTPQSTPLAILSGVPDAERRQLTVLCCDMVGAMVRSGQLDPEDLCVDATALATQLDPEALRDVLRAYQAACAEVIRRFEGHIAQYLGQGLLVYFGYPLAHDDDAQRAVRAGLGLVEAMGPLNTRLAQHPGVRVATRIGIHTGLVVVGTIGEEGRHTPVALGEPPEMAARLQRLAATNTVVISAATARLVEGYFVCQPLEAPPGGAPPSQAVRVLQASGAQTRLDVRPPRGFTPLVGRAEEVALLHARWGHATRGRGQVVLLSGEPGIGKSRLVQVLQDAVAAEAHLRIEWRGLSSSQQSALHPVIDHLHRRLQGLPGDPPSAKLHTLEAMLTASGVVLSEAVPLLAALLALPLPASYPPLTLTPQWQRQRTFATLRAWLHAEAQRQPVLLVVEDLHWLDPSTVELLSLLIEQGTQARLCLILTARPEFRQTWNIMAHVTVLTLRRLAPDQVAQMATQVAGDKALPAEVVAQIVAKTEGVPLFVEELTKMVLESGLIQEGEAHYALPAPLPPLAIPATLQDTLLARLDRLAAAKGVAQWGATIGRAFAYELLHAVVPLDAATLQGALAQLVAAEVVVQRGHPPQATYVFRHALIQETAYQSLLKSTRRQIHQQIAQVLRERFPETQETQPEFLAHHYMEAGLQEQAIGYWQQAGQRAIERSANLEAIGHLTTGLDVLKTLPDTPERTQHELTLHTALGVPLRATKGLGAPEVGQVYARARELCQQVEETPQLFPVLRGLWEFYELRGELQTAREVGEQLLTLAQRVQEAELLLVAHSVLGDTLLALGEFAVARAHLEQGLALYNPQQHRSHAFLYGYDSGVHCLAFGAWALWYLGYPDHALRSIHAALTLAQELSHPFSLAFALAFAAWLHQLRREGPAAQEQAAVAIALATDQGFALWESWGAVLRGSVLAAQGQSAEGIAQIRQGIAAWRATGAELQLPYYLALLVEAYGQAGQAAEGLRVLAEALTTVHNTGERQHEAELYRLKGELLLTQGVPDTQEAENCLRQAVAVARQQQAKSLELRAAMSLSRLWQQQGKRQEASDLLAPVYGWFTEGFDTADLQEAKALLGELGGTRGSIPRGEYAWPKTVAQGCPRGREGGACT